MDVAHYITRFRANAEAFALLLRGVADAQAKWKPAPNNWSLLEVINHLYDEEREDFRQRLQLTLADPAADWPKIDPENWAIDRKYNERDLHQSLESFLKARAHSVEWLHNLHEPQWHNEKIAPWGKMCAGDLLASWLAHDHLHLRQMNDLHYAWHKHTAQPFDVSYAGDW